MLRQLEGSRGVAEAVAMSRPEVICAYPITPQTHIVETLSATVKAGELTAEFLNVESEFAAMSAAIGASAAGIARPICWREVELWPEARKEVIAVKSTVQDIMTTRVVAVRRSTPFKEMAARLHRERVSAFPVVDDEGKVVGIVSETDLLPKETLDAGWATGIPEMTSRILRDDDQEKAESVTAADLMTQPAVTAAPGDTVEHAARLMYVRQVKRLPVTDASRRLVGIVSRADVLSVFDRSDEEIRKEITENLILAEFRAAPDRFTVTVENGVVTLAGSPETAALGRAIVGRARHVEGAVAVRDRLQYPPA